VKTFTLLSLHGELVSARLVWLADTCLIMTPKPYPSLRGSVFHTLTAVSYSLLLCLSAFAADTVKKSYDVPSGDAEMTLKVFAEQSGEQILYPPVKVSGIQTNAVRGEMFAGEALDVMLRDTKLMAVRNEKTGAYAIQKAATVAEAEKNAQRVAQKNSDHPATTELTEKEKERIIELDPYRVTVTAQKREEMLQNVPISISVLRGSKLDSSSAVGVTDAMRAVPGIDTTTDQYTGGVAFSARGVSNGYNSRASGAGPIAYYIDGVPYGFVRNAFYPDPSIYDLKQIEFLAGPQGTLYGANALNGVLRITTENANADRFEFKAHTLVSATAEGGENYRGDVAVNIPLIKGKLGVRAVVGYKDDTGWIDARDPNLPAQNKDDINYDKRKSFRLKIHGQPTDTLSIDLLAWRLESDVGAPPWSNDLNQITTAVPQTNGSKANVYGMEINKEFSTFSVSSVTSYLDYIQKGTVSGQPVGFQATLSQDYRAKVFTEEINLVSSLDGPWRWSAGAFYREAKDLYHQLYTFLPPSTTQLVNNHYGDTSESSAVYGEIGRNLSDNLSFTVGLRYFRDKGELRLLKAYNRPAALSLPPLPIGNNYSSVSEAVTPRAVLKWTPTQNRTFYASYSEGFRSGFAQQPTTQAVFPDFTPVQPDNLRNYEVGAKGSLFNGKLSFSGAVYYIDWQDIQRGLNLELPNGLLSLAVVNGASASGPGYEFSVVARPFERLELTASYGWNDLVSDAEVRSGSLVISKKGDRLSFSPEHMIGWGVQYTHPLGASGFKAVAGLSGDYTSAPNATPSFGNSQGTVGGNDIHLLGARFSLEAPRGWTAIIFVDNLTDLRKSASPNFFPPEWSSHFRPRTIGVMYEFRY
jgi:iron complex outermembrane receptor protein